MTKNLVVNSLFKHPQQFDFFQAVQLLEQNNAIRFCAAPSLSFPVSDIKKVEFSDAKVAVQVNFMGLTGPSGVLPDHYTEFLISRLQLKDSTLSDFFDLFNHRTITLFYCAWKKYHFYSGDKQFIDIISALVGNNNAVKNVPAEAILFYSGYFARKLRSGVMLENMLADYFALRIVVKQFEGCWLFLKQNECTRLINQENSFAQLGRNTMLGQSVWNVQHKFRLCIGQLNYQEFLNLLPGTHKLTTLIALARYYVGVELNFDVQLILQASEVPYCQLRQQESLRLGWNTWLKSRAFVQDANDTVINK